MSVVFVLKSEASKPFDFRVSKGHGFNFLLIKKICIYFKTVILRHILRR